MLVCFTASSAFSQNSDRAKKQGLTKNNLADAKDGLQQKKENATKTMYTCAMHPEVVQEKPGKCPSCGMTLEQKSMDKMDYTCPMHKQVMQDKSGKCPQCKMKLVKNELPKKENAPKK